MKNDVQPILLDRMMDFAAVAGIKMKRTQALGLLASALGYHNTHEMSVAISKGDLDPPHAEEIAMVDLPNGEEMIVVRDPASGSVYGIDASFVDQVVEEERRERIGVTPYGTMVRLDQVGAMPIPKATGVRASGAGQADLVEVSFIEHKHGHTAFVDRTEDGLYAQMAKWCRDYWHEITDHDDVPKSTDGMTDREIVSLYFDIQTDFGDETMTLCGAEPIGGGAPTVPAPQTPVVPAQIEPGADYVGRLHEIHACRDDTIFNETVLIPDGEDVDDFAARHVASVWGEDVTEWESLQAYRDDMDGWGVDPAPQAEATITMLEAAAGLIATDPGNPAFTALKAAVDDLAKHRESFDPTF